MTITKNNNNGRFYFSFTVNGKKYHRACKGCTSRAQAEEFERKIRKTIIGLSAQKSAKAIIENYKRELTGGTDILLSSAFEIYLSKPARRHPCQLRQEINRRHWEDFVAFMKARYPEVTHLDQVTRTHAEAYIDYLRTNGRFVQDVSCGKGNAGKLYRPQKTCLSTKTINEYHTILKSVFSRLENDAGIVDNPFNFDSMKATTETREIFTDEELVLIAHNLKEDPFCRPLFIIGANTGLSLGDVCSLKWSDIITDTKGCFIHRRRNKTRTLLEIPVMPAVQSLFNELASYRDSLELDKQSPFILPEHEAMYRTNRSGVSYRINKFLTRLGIKTTRETTGSRDASIKDFHSLRHTFAYFAGVNHIPLPIVQGVLGHMSPQMTKYYQAHATREDKLSLLGQLPALLGGDQLRAQLPESTTPQSESLADEDDINHWRSKVAGLIDELSIEELKDIVQRYAK